MVGAGMQSGLQGAPSRNHPTRGGSDPARPTRVNVYLSEDPNSESCIGAVLTAMGNDVIKISLVRKYEDIFQTEPQKNPFFLICSRSLHLSR
jgi:hypothetical protein